MSSRKKISGALLVTTLAVFMLVSGCSGGGGGGGGSSSTTAAVQTDVTLSGFVDNQQTSPSGTSSSPVAGATVTVVDFTGAQVGTSTLTDSTGKYTTTVPKNKAYAIRVEKTGGLGTPTGRTAATTAVMKAVVSVGATDATADVNIGTTAVVLVYEQKFSVQLAEVGTSVGTAFDSVDIAATTTAIYVNAGFSTLAQSVQAAVAANTDPATSPAVVAQAQTLAATTTVTTTSGATLKLLGGAMQGKPLSLTTAVSTFAGSNSLDGIGAAAKFNYPGDITSDGTNLYVADTTNHTIRKFVIATGAVTTIAGTVGIAGSADGVGAAARFYIPTGIVTDGTNLYVTDRGNQTIRQIVISTGAVTTIAGTVGIAGSADGTGAAAQFNGPTGITINGSNLYVADFGNSTIRQIALGAGSVTTIAGTAGAIGSADGIGTTARFGTPTGITSDGTNLYVTDGLQTIRQIVIATGAVTTIAGTAWAGGSTDGIGAAARFGTPTGITTDGTNLYIADGNNTIRQVVIATGVVTTIAGTAGVFGSADGTGAAAQFNSPWGIITVGTNLYVADTYNCTIRQFVIATGAVTTIAGTAFSSYDGIGTSARFMSPQNITTDGMNLYVTDNNAIRQIDMSTGSVTTLAGTIWTWGYADGAGAAALFNWAYGITTDGTNLYVADYYNRTIRQVVIVTGAVTTLAGTAGVIGSADGIGAAASFGGLYGITTDGANLYVVDYAYHTIRQVVIATGAVTTLAGTAGVGGSADGTGTAAQFAGPVGITTDGTNLYVTDSGNNTIRQIVIATGAVTTIAGTAGVAGSADGVGVAASFNFPYGITTDGTNLYVTEYLNNTIRQIVIATGAVTTIAGTAGVGGSTDGTGAAAQFGKLGGIATDGTSLYVADPMLNSAIRKIQ